MKKLSSKLLAISIVLTLLLQINTSFSSFSVQAQENADNNTIIFTTPKSQLSAIDNIVVFVRFAGQDEFVTQQHLETVNKVYNTNTDSLKNYISTLSYGGLTVTTTFLNGPGTSLSYQAPQNLNYYLTQTGDTSSSELILQSILSDPSFITQLNAIGPDNLDRNDDGKIDSLQFIFNLDGQSSQNTGLWPSRHQSFTSEGYGSVTLQKDGESVIKTIDCYILQNALSPNNNIFASPNYQTGVVIHEYLHLLGLHDLYGKRENGTDHTCFAGEWDIMSSSERPVNILQYFQRNVLGWGDSIETITENGTYQIKAAQYQDEDYDNGNSAEENGNIKTAYILSSPLSSNEVIVIECRSRYGYDNSVGSSYQRGLIVYRINTEDLSNTPNSPNVYIFRPDTTDPQNIFSNPTNASLGETIRWGRKTLGKALGEESTSGFDGQTIYFSSGANSGIVIKNVSTVSDVMSFEVELPVEASTPATGDGTPENPFVITTENELNYIRTNLDKSFRLGNDLTLGANFIPINGEFTGTLDGNNKSIHNLSITTNQLHMGLFSHISGSITDLTIDTPSIINTYPNGSCGALAGYSTNASIENVHVIGGTISSNRAGGIIGDFSDSSMTGCTASAAITAEIEAGGLTSLLRSGQISDCSFSGSVNGTASGGCAGIILSGTLSNCFSSAAVKSIEAPDNPGALLPATNGGIAGQIYVYPYGSSCTFSNVYWDVTKSGQAIGYNYNYLNPLMEPIAPVTGIIGVSIPVETALTSGQTQQLAVTTVPANAFINGSWSTDSYYSKVSVSTSGAVTALYNGSSDIFFTISVNGKPFVLTSCATVSGMTDAPKYMIIKEGSHRALIDGSIYNTTINNGTYVTFQSYQTFSVAPLRFVAEVFGMDVGWDSSTQSTTVTNPSTGSYVSLQIGSTVLKQYNYNGELLGTITLTQAPVSIGGSTYIPVYVIPQAFGLQTFEVLHTDSSVYYFLTNRIQTMTTAEIDAMLNDAAVRLVNDQA